MYRLFGMSGSGNCHKVRLLLEQLGLDYRWQEVDVVGGATREPAFLALNPNGRVPLLELEPGVLLPESNAILCYLADGTPLWPTERLARARTLQWLFFEQYTHEPAIAVARFICKFLPPDHPRRHELPRLLDRGHAALDVMEQHLSTQPFFVGDRYSIADLGLFPYTRAADEGGFDLARYPAIGAWFARVEAQPGFVAMERSGAPP